MTHTKKPCQVGWRGFYLLDARGVEADARQGRGWHGVRVEGDGVRRVRAVPVSQQQVLRPRVEPRRHLYEMKTIKDTASREIT